MSVEHERKTIPPELENMLIEFTVKVLIESPEDMVSYAADYFTQMRDTRSGDFSGGENLADEGSAEYIARTLGTRRKRRGTVMGEKYNPEEDTDSEVEIHPKTDEQRQRIRHRTEDIFLFRTLDEIDLSAVIDAMIPTPVTAGKVIIKEGDDGDFFYLIDKGDFEILIEDDNGRDQHVGTYEGEGFFGELALLHNQPRAATIKAASDGFLWAMSRKTFNKLIVKRAFEKRQLYVRLLDGVPELKPLTQYEKMQVADALRGRSYMKGEVILREGDEGDGMYFVIEGKLSVIQSLDDGGQKEIAQLRNGEFFGELALVKHQPRAATVVALEDTKAAFLEVKAFERLLGPCMDIMKRRAEAYKRDLM